MIKLKQVIASCGVAAMLSAATVQAATMPILVEGFNGGVPAGWTVINRSSPIGNGQWGQGNPNFFSAQAGPADSYVTASYQDGSPLGAIVSDWLLTPTLTIGNGYTISFYARADIETANSPDSLQIRLSTNGGSTNVGTSATSVGDFATLLLSINSALAPGGFPTDWMQYTATVSGLSALTTGKFAFRYFLADNLTQGSLIGVDSVVITAIPEPETTLLLALGLSALGLSLRRKARR